MSNDRHFLYAFVTLHASIKGWEYGRPVAVVDRSFLKAGIQKTMLITSTSDATG